ncbi:MAG: peptidase [Cytophagales bacterium]|nr:peptidase [Cytophagales bacterium]
MFTVEIKSEPNEDICLLIKVANHSFNYICDCGEAKNLGVKECQDTQAIFISHTHIDHFVNFDTILRHQIGMGKKVIICGPNGIINQVQNRIKSYCWNLIAEGAISYEIREINGDGKIRTVALNPPLWEQEKETVYDSPLAFEEKDFVVEYEILDHKTDSIAYLFKGKDKTKIQLENGFKGGKWVSELKNLYEQGQENVSLAIDGTEYLSKDLFCMVKTEKGKTVGVIMDHDTSAENHEKILNKFQNCDEAYIECFYKNEDKEFALKNAHSYAAMSGEIMKKCKVKKAIPVHFSRKYGQEEVQELITQFEESLQEK